MEGWERKEGWEERKRGEGEKEGSFVKVSDYGARRSVPGAPRWQKTGLIIIIIIIIIIIDY